MMKRIMTAAMLACCLMTMPAFAGERLSGGWEATRDTTIDADAQAVFDAAMEGLLGVDYEAVDLLATQVVAGTNYCFLCRSTVVVPDALPGYSLVYIYQDLSGNAQILGIKDITFGEGILEEADETELLEDTTE